MFPEDQGAAETAISFTDQFVDAAVAKLDALFGSGYAKEHPHALAGYIAACSSNLNAFMTAATAIPDEEFGEALAAFEALRPETQPKSKGRRR